MKKNYLMALVVIFLLEVRPFIAFGQNEKFNWDFSEGNIRDILYAVSLDSGYSIGWDDTVSGKAEWKFSGSDFDTGFDMFLKSNNLYLEKKKDVWTVSRIKIEKSEELYSLDVFELTAHQIVEKLASKIEKPITYDYLPSGVYTMHFKNLPLEELLKCIALRFSGMELEIGENRFHFVKNTGIRKNDFSNGYIDISKSIVGQKNGYKVNVKDSKFSEVMEKLFELEGNQFCFLANSELKISRVNFVAESFEKTLKLLCNQNGLVPVLNDGIYYLIADADVKNHLINGECNWEKINLKFSCAEKVIPVITRKMGKLDTVAFPDGTSFLIKIAEKERQEIFNLVKELDVKTNTYVLNLKYLKPEDFIKQIPPSVNKSNISMAEDKSCVYFTGTEESYKQLCEELSIFDKPADRITYDLLILQCDGTTDNQWASNLQISPVTLGDRTSGGIQLGSVLGFNLNVVTTFGLNFAAELQSSIEENKTKVFADTVLHGVSGKNINFQNTSTYRYRDNNLDPDTGKPVYSGITREIVSGLKLDVVGWISGNGMITSTVTASVTRRGTDTSSSTGNPPPTTEKIITTEVCGQSGEPVILSGLIQNADTIEVKRSPIISKIPIFGNLFKSQEKFQEKSQMIIYLVPHVESYMEEKVDEEEVRKNRIRERCKNFVNRFMGVEKDA